MAAVLAWQACVMRAPFDLKFGIFERSFLRRMYWTIGFVMVVCVKRKNLVAASGNLSQEWQTMSLHQSISPRTKLLSSSSVFRVLVCLVLIIISLSFDSNAIIATNITDTTTTVATSETTSPSAAAGDDTNQSTEASTPEAHPFSYEHLHLTPQSSSASRLMASWQFSQPETNFPIQCPFEISLTQGRLQQGKPVGLELVASCADYEEFRALVHQLSGLLCASVNFLDVEDSVTYAAGTVSSMKQRLRSASNSQSAEGKPSSAGSDTAQDEGPSLFYATLSRETVCTENLTPFKKLLKNRAKSGIGALLNPLKLFDSDYYSMQVKYEVGNGDTAGRLTQRVDVLFDLLKGIEKRRLSDWSLETLFGTTVRTANPLVDESKIFVHLNEDLLQHAESYSSDEEIFSLRPKPNAVHSTTSAASNGTSYEDLVREASLVSAVGSTSSRPQPQQIYEYNLKDPERPLVRNVEFSWHNTSGIPVPRMKQKHAVSAHRYQSGYGLLDGGLTLTIENHEDEEMLIRYFEAIPWVFRVYFHTLEFSVNGTTTLQPFSSDFESFSITPAVERKSPSEIEFALRLPARSFVVMKIQFDKMFLRYTEHPPDANRGFDLASSVVTYCRLNSDSECSLDQLDVFNTSHQQRVYTESLLISLPTPDFSMPYNVIMLTSTIITMFFGSLFNVLIRRDDALSSSEEETKEEDLAEEQEFKEE